MDRIRKALDLARAERARFPGADGAAAGERAAVAVADERQIASELRLAAALEAAVAEPSAERRSGRERSAATARTFQPDAAILERNYVLAQRSTSPAAEAFRLLRTQVLQRLEDRDWRVLAVVSPNVDDSRPRVAANLAAAIAADTRYHALLVDLDLRAPAIADLFGLRPERGVDDVLAGAASVDDCLYRPAGYERLVLLPARAPLPRGAELLASPASRRLLAELRERYPDRLIVCSLAPVLAADEALAFAPLADCALLVVTEALTERADLGRAMSLLQRTPVVGSVLGNASGAGRSTE